MTHQISNTRLAHHCVFAFCFALLTACGGGSNNTPPPPAPPPPPPPDEVALNLDNAKQASIVAISTVEHILQIADETRKSVQSIWEAGASQFSSSCPNGGVVDYDFTDNDQNAEPSAGDVIRVTFRDCETVSLNAVAAGDLLINLTEPSDGVFSENNFASQVDPTSLDILTQFNRSLTTNGSFNIEILTAQLGQSILASGDTAVSATADGTTTLDVLEQFQFSKTLSYETARFEISAMGTVDSESLGGEFTFEPTQTISGFFNTYPESGSLEIVGLENSRIMIVPNFVTDSVIAEVFADSTGDGAFEALEDNPFWNELSNGYLFWYEEGSPDQFRTNTFDANDFFLVHYTPDGSEPVPVNAPLRVQFSRPLDPMTVPSMIEARVDLNEAPFSETVVFDVELSGATIFFRPRSQLVHGATYRYPNRSFEVLDEFGNRSFLSSTGFETRNNLIAVATTDSALVTTGGIVQLDGSGSTATDSEITSFSWSQLAGPTVTIVNRDQALAQFTVPTISQAELIRLELEIVNAEGETNSATVEVSAFGSATDIQVLAFSGDEGDFISQGRDWFLTSVNGTFAINRNFDNGVSVNHTTPSPNFASWNLELAAPGDQQIVPGVYEGATRFPFQDAANPGLTLSGDGRGCNTSNGRFEVFEITYDGAGNVLTAAVDFEQFCEGGAAKLSGSLRIGSSLPIP